MYIYCIYVRVRVYKSINLNTFSKCCQKNSCSNDGKCPKTRGMPQLLGLRRQKPVDFIVGTSEHWTEARPQVATPPPTWLATVVMSRIFPRKETHVMSPTVHFHGFLLGFLGTVLSTTSICCKTSSFDSCLLPLQTWIVKARSIVLHWLVPFWGPCFVSKYLGPATIPAQQQLHRDCPQVSGSKHPPPPPPKKHQLSTRGWRHRLPPSFTLNISKVNNASLEKWGEETGHAVPKWPSPTATSMLLTNKTKICYEAKRQLLWAVWCFPW